ncbi:hypothetical protein F7725_015611, partial [Dissostichus mawsoni]
MMVPKSFVLLVLHFARILKLSVWCCSLMSSVRNFCSICSCRRSMSCVDSSCRIIKACSMSFWVPFLFSSWDNNVSFGQSFQLNGDQLLLVLPPCALIPRHLLPQLKVLLMLLDLPDDLDRGTQEAGSKRKRSRQSETTAMVETEGGGGETDS